jgi:hypothetical protein
MVVIATVSLRKAVCKLAVDLNIVAVYSLVSRHIATDPVIYVAFDGTGFSAHFWDVFLHFPALCKQTSFI